MRKANDAIQYRKQHGVHREEPQPHSLNQLWGQRDLPWEDSCRRSAEAHHSLSLVLPASRLVTDRFLWSAIAWINADKKTTTWGLQQMIRRMVLDMKVKIMKGENLKKEVLMTKRKGVFCTHVKPKH